MIQFIRASISGQDCGPFTISLAAFIIISVAMIINVPFCVMMLLFVCVVKLVVPKAKITLSIQHVFQSMCFNLNHECGNTTHHNRTFYAPFCLKSLTTRLIDRFIILISFIILFVSWTWGMFCTKSILCIIIYIYALARAFAFTITLRSWWRRPRTLSWLCLSCSSQCLAGTAETLLHLILFLFCWF